MSEQTEGVERPTPTEAEARRRYIQGELDAVLPSTHDGKFKVKILGLGESKWLNITADQYDAVKKILLPEPESPVSYNPCIQGKVLIEGAESEFMILLDNDSVGFSQWGAPNEVLWQRVELLDNLCGPAREWWADNKPQDDDECECSESYRHRGEHTPGCPADDGERGPLDD